jgi:molybdopterin molybdotransferase
MLQVLSLCAGREQLLARAAGRTPKTEQIALERARGRVLAQDIAANSDLPDFNRSSVDGWAVVAADTFGASAALPALLECRGEVNMGEQPEFSLENGFCAAVWTGGELPQGADAMVMLEDGETLPGGQVAIYSATSPGRHVVFRGEDAAAGQTVLCAGTRLSARDVGALAAIGETLVPVRAMPRVCVLSTGDELIDPAKAPFGAQIRDCNGPMLTAACQQTGANAAFCGRIADDEALLKETMRSLAANCDLLLLSGGSSAGAKDAAARCLGELGEVFFHGLAVKPGKPTFAGTIGDALVVGLPGHPAAAYLVFYELVRPLLAAMQGEALVERTIPAALASAVPSNHGREELVPVLLGEGTATHIPSKSGVITTLARADGYFRIPRDVEGLPKGARVDVILF